MKYRITRVDPSRPEVAHTLMMLQAACLPGDTPHNVDVGSWWIAENDDSAVGFAGMVPSLRWSDTIYLCRSGVVQSHQGNGLQKRMISARVRHARRLGYRWAITDTTDNPASSNSLIAAGFKLFKPTRPWGFDNTNYWRLKL